MIVLALSIYVFVPMFPAVFGPIVLGRIAIGISMLLFAAVELELVRAARERQEVRRPESA